MSTQPDCLDSAPWPTSTVELDASEALLVWAIRRWAMGLQDDGGRHFALVQAEFTRQLGRQDANRAVAGVVGITRAFQEHARRLVRLHQPACPCLGADEVWLVSLVGSCQRGELYKARALAEWMVCADGIGALLESVGQLARLLRGHDLLIPERSRGDGAVSAVSLTIH